MKNTGAGLVNFGQDLQIILVLWLVGVGFARLSYWCGAPTWPACFVIPGFRQNRYICGGEVGEIANLSLIAGVLVLLLVLTPEANIYDLVHQHWPIAIIFGLSSAALISIYAAIAVYLADRNGLPQGTEKTERSMHLLAIGYRFYVGYCTVIALLIWGIFFVTLNQTLMDNIRFHQIEAHIFDVLRNLSDAGVGNSERVQLMFEVVFGQQKIAKGYVLDQVNSLLMLLLCIALAYFVVYKTGIRHVFAPAALKTLQVILFVLIGVCVLVGCVVFFSIHLVFVDRMLDEFRRYATLMNAGPWTLTQRYQELVAELTEQRGIFGFIVALATDRGGLVLIMPALQLLMMKGHDRGTAEPTQA